MGTTRTENDNGCAAVETRKKMSVEACGSGGTARSGGRKESIWVAHKHGGALKETVLTRSKSCARRMGMHRKLVRWWW